MAITTQVSGLVSRPIALANIVVPRTPAPSAAVKDSLAAVSCSVASLYAVLLVEPNIAAWAAFCLTKALAIAASDSAIKAPRKIVDWVISIVFVVINIAALVK